MAPKKKTSKKKTRKKSSRSHKAAVRKVTPAKKQARKRKTPKKSAKRAAARKKAAPKKKALKNKKTAPRKTASASTGKTSKRNRARRAPEFPVDLPESHSGEQSGDLQGLSNVEDVDSESVDELLEEGNAFEAGVVSGVEDAGEHSEREVRTREVPEDDVPGEYLDED